MTQVMRFFCLLLLLCTTAQAAPIPMGTFNFVAQNITFQWVPDVNGLPRYGEFRFQSIPFWSPYPVNNCIRLDTWSAEIGTVLPANQPVSLFQIITWRERYPNTTAVVNCP